MLLGLYLINQLNKELKIRNIKETITKLCHILIDYQYLLDPHSKNCIPLLQKETVCWIFALTHMM